MADFNPLAILSGLARGAAGVKEFELAEQLKRQEEERAFQQELDIRQLLEQFKVDAASRAARSNEAEKTMTAEADLAGLIAQRDALKLEPQFGLGETPTTLPEILRLSAQIKGRLEAEGVKRKEDAKTPTRASFALDAAKQMAPDKPEQWSALALQLLRQSDQSGQRPLTATAESLLITRLWNQWRVENRTRVELMTTLNRMKTGLEAARRGDLQQGAQVILVTFQKMLDPTSVVRESEYARSAEGLSLINKILGSAEQLRKGGAGVPLSELEKFVRLGQDLVDQQADYLGSVKKRVSRNAKHFGIPEELIFEEFDFESGGGVGESLPPPTPDPDDNEAILKWMEWFGQQE